MRALWLAGGYLLTGTGLVGYWLPGVPGTVFLIMALFCFYKGGDERMRAWLLNNRLFGATLRDWEENKAISLRIKWVACTCIAVSCGLSCIVIPPIWVKAVVAILGLAGIAYIVTRNTAVVKPVVVSKKTPAA
ncbi:MAG: YbaN family protein [Fimbriimonadaceae bacterium]